MFMIFERYCHSFSTIRSMESVNLKIRKSQSARVAQRKREEESGGEREQNSPGREQIVKKGGHARKVGAERSKGERGGGDSKNEKERGASRGNKKKIAKKPDFGQLRTTNVICTIEHRYSAA